MSVVLVVYNGSYIICMQTSIESIAESMALAEQHGVDRNQVMEILSSSIFDCLIYKVLFLFICCEYSLFNRIEGLW